MSEFTDSLITQHLNQTPSLRDAYHHDAPTYHQVNLMRRMLETTERAMEREGIAAESRKRVLETIVYGDPDVEKLRRERDLLLTRFDPSEFGRPSSPVFTEPSPRVGPVRPGEEPTT